MDVCLFVGSPLRQAGATFLGAGAIIHNQLGESRAENCTSLVQAKDVDVRPTFGFLVDVPLGRDLGLGGWRFNPHTLHATVGELPLYSGLVEVGSHSSFSSFCFWPGRVALQSHAAKFLSLEGAYRVPCLLRQASQHTSTASFPIPALSWVP